VLPAEVALRDLGVTEQAVGFVLGAADAPVEDVAAVGDTEAPAVVLLVYAPV